MTTRAQVLASGLGWQVSDIICDAGPHERPQPQERRDVGAVAHADGHGRQPGAARLLEERAAGLTRDEGRPAVGLQPARLPEDPDLLAPQPEGGLRVEN